MSNRRFAGVGAPRRRLAWTGAFLACVLISGFFLVTQVTPRARRASAAQANALIDRRVSALLAGIPQNGNALGSPRAPITLQIFGDLQCLDVKYWFASYLFPIIKDFVRPNILRIEYRAMKTDTLNPEEFVIEHTAALAAGAQDVMWNFLDTFYYEQRREYTSYVNEQYLTGIAEQVRGLDLLRWNRERVPAFARAVITDDRMARRLGFHDTPAFRIGRTGGTLRDFSGRNVIVYHKFKFETGPKGKITHRRLNSYAHPLSLVDANDIRQVLEKQDF